MATDRFKKSVIYKMCYYRMAEVTGGQDYARGQNIGDPQLTLSHFDEAYTTENWIVRIFKVRTPQNRSPEINGKSGDFKGLTRR